MKLWFDEDLSHTLVQVAADFGLLATCNRDRGVLGKSDVELMPMVVGEDYVFVTDNRRDFRKLYQPRGGVHPGLVFVPGTGSRELQQQHTRRVIAWILDEAAARETSAEDLMINKLVELDPATDIITIQWLPGDD